MFAWLDKCLRNVKSKYTVGQLPTVTLTHLLLVSGGRSRLHLLDLGSCDVKLLGGGGGGGKSKETSSLSSAPLCLSLSALGNVILALVNGSKHIPYK